jgi:hypothetical protein
MVIKLRIMINARVRKPVVFYVGKPVVFYVEKPVVF